MLSNLPFSNREHNYFSNLLNLFDELTPIINSGTFKLDISDKDNSYIIHADLPGVKKDEISFDYKNNYFTIKVSRNQEEDESNDNYLYRERSESLVDRTIYLENINVSEINAKLENGVLTIVIPKVEPKSTKLDINIE